MDPQRWERVQQLFHAVADLSAPERESALAAACDGDELLYAEVQSLLRAEGDTQPILRRGLPGLAAGIVSEAVPMREIGAYRLERVVGEGGMGTVFLGRRDDIGSVAAIKVLRDAWISPERRRRFAAEQRMLAGLDHPNIARLLDADTMADGTPFFVMEFIDGVPLVQYALDNALPPRDRIELFLSVCRAVQFAHRHAVIHRDLKPSNILVRADGQVKLLDFGIAKQLDTLDEPAGHTRTGLQLLTPAYASPEQRRGEPAAMHNDVYSLGVILYELLTGARPAENPAPLQPAELDVLCKTAMHPDVAKRYGSAEALTRDVEHYRNGEPLEALPDSFGYRFGKFLRRRRRAVVAGLGAVLLLGVVTVYFTVRLARERNAALAEAARTQRIQRFVQNLFLGGDKDAGPAQDLKVSTLIERGVQEAKALDPDPAVQAEFYQTLGDIYQKMGHLDRADSLLQLALDRRSGRQTGENLVAIGLLRADQARIEDAERLVREGLARIRQDLPAGHPAIAAATDALGHVLEEKGTYDEAIPILQEAVRLRSLPGADPADLAASLYELANVYFYAGRYKESEELNRRVLEMTRKIYGPGHPKVAEALVNLGAIHQDSGRYQEAERYHREALQITRAFFGEQHTRTASNLTMVARALVFQKRHEEAEELLRQAVRIQEAVYGQQHPRVASAVNELGNVALMRSRYPEAREAFARIERIYRAVYNGKHYLIGTALSNLASVYMAEKEYPKAEKLFREAVAMFNETLPPNHLNTGIARIKLGRTLLRQKRFRDAITESGAGYGILKAQATPSVSFLQSARSDLADAYDAVGEGENARKMRAESALLDAKTRK